MPHWKGTLTSIVPMGKKHTPSSSNGFAFDSMREHKDNERVEARFPLLGSSDGFSFAFLFMF